MIELSLLFIWTLWIIIINLTYFTPWKCLSNTFMSLRLSIRLSNPRFEQKNRSWMKVGATFWVVKWRNKFQSILLNQAFFEWNSSKLFCSNSLISPCLAFSMSPTTIWRKFSLSLGMPRYLQCSIMLRQMKKLVKHTWNSKMLYIRTRSRVYRIFAQPDLSWYRWVFHCLCSNSFLFWVLVFSPKTKIVHLFE